MATEQAKLNHIGLDLEKTEATAEALNSVLAAYHVHYQNLRGFHWNVKGHVFFELHEKFEEMYEDAKDRIDELAERILTLGFTPMHAMSDYVDNAQMKEMRNVSNDAETVKYTVRDLQGILTKEREAWKRADDAFDLGTTNLLEEYINTQEKNIWMLNSWLNKRTININGDGN